MSGPFPDVTVEAIAACTRALTAAPGGSRDPRETLLLPGAIAAALDRADAATRSGLRAYADRLAVRRRCHDPAVHQRGTPADAREARIFDALENARLDALGVRWLPGVAKNLLDHPGAGRDALRWLAFETLSGRSAPPIKSGMVRALRAGLPAPLVEALHALASGLDHQAPFAAAAAEWARRAAALVPIDDTPAHAGARVLLPTRTVVRELPRRGDPGGSPAPLQEPSGQHAHGPDGASGAGAPVAATGARTGYHAYTTAHDRTVNAAALASREELERLRVTLDAELSSIRSLVARLAKRLLRALMARQTREWRFDLDEGVLDASRLAPLIASGGAARPFKQESESPFPGTVVTLLIDHSGSMRGRPMRIAALTVEIFARVLERCGVKCEVLGFTTRDWDGGEPAREWAAHGYPEHPGRLNALEHLVVKGADVPWRRARIGLGLFMRDEMLKENIDGEALQWAHARLLARSEPRRILVVVSDGTPMDEATMAANGHDYLENHLQEVIDAIEARSPVRLAAIGIGHDVSAFYSNATRLAKIDDLGPALTGALIGLLDLPSA